MFHELCSGQMTAGIPPGRPIRRRGMPPTSRPVRNARPPVHGRFLNGAELQRGIVLRNGRPLSRVLGGEIGSSWAKLPTMGMRSALVAR